MSALNRLVPRTESVTPELAERWLKHQFGGQRRLRDHHVFLLASEMERGSFVPHNAISFAIINGDRILIDGQHRLSAVVLYGRPVTMAVLDIPAASLDDVRRLYGNIDQGLRRSAIDAIRAAGLAEEFGLSERRVQRISGALRVIASRFTDATGGEAKGETRRNRAFARSNAVNSLLLRAWRDDALRYSEIVDGGEPSVVTLFDRGAVLACALLSLRYGGAEARDFWYEAARDDALSKHDPRKRFIVWLRENKNAKSGEVARAFAVAWKNLLRQSELKLLRYSMRTPLEIERVDLDHVEREIRTLVESMAEDRQ